MSDGRASGEWSGVGQEKGRKWSDGHTVCCIGGRSEKATNGAARTERRRGEAPESIEGHPKKEGREEKKEGKAMIAAPRHIHTFLNVVLWQTGTFVCVADLSKSWGSLFTVTSKALPPFM